MMLDMLWMLAPASRIVSRGMERAYTFEVLQVSQLLCCTPSAGAVGSTDV